MKRKSSIALEKMRQFSDSYQWHQDSSSIIFHLVSTQAKSCRSSPARRFPNWLAVQVEMVSIAARIPYTRNPRQRSAERMAQLAASLKEFGHQRPATVWWSL